MLTVRVERLRALRERLRSLGRAESALATSARWRRLLLLRSCGRLQGVVIIPHTLLCGCSESEATAQHTLSGLLRARERTGLKARMSGDGSASMLLKASPA